MSAARIGKLEALLARIKANASAPRVIEAHAHQAAEPAPTSVTVPPTADAQEALEEERVATIPPPAQIDAPPEREVEVPLESRARLVAAPHAEAEPEEIEADDVIELDDRHVVADESQAVDVNAATIAGVAVMEEEGPPPSSRRPIAEPAETPQEAQIQVAHTPPPESGKQVASDALSFDDDFTGVREAPQPVARPEPSISLQSLRSPEAPPPPDEMEVEIPAHAPVTMDATRPPPGPSPEIPDPMAATPHQGLPSAEVSRPTRPVAAAHIAEMASNVAASAPKTFGELLDAALSL